MLLAALEEISWGQHIFGFESGEYFLEKNHQQETNIHNLVDGNLFSSIIYFCVYTFFIFLPAITSLFPKLLSSLPLTYLIPSTKVALIVLFGSTFQLYFYDDFGVLSDMVTLVVAFILYGLVLMLRCSSLEILFHLLGVVLMVLNMLHYEMFVVLGVFYWFVETTQKLDRPLASFARG